MRNTIGLEADIKDTLKINSENMKWILKNSKRKKFNYLKYHRTCNPAQKANQSEFPVLYNNTTNTPHNKTSEENYRPPTNNTNSKPWNSLFKKTSYTNVRSKQSYTNAQYASNKGNASISAFAEEHIQELKKEIASIKAGNKHEAPKNDLPDPHNPRGITQQHPSQTEPPRKELQPLEVISFHGLLEYTDR